jgi:hypothetical protein
VNKGSFYYQIELIRAPLAAAVEFGELQRPAEDVDGAAKAIVAQVEGLVLFAKLFNDPAHLGALAEQPAAPGAGARERREYGEGVTMAVEVRTCAP